MSRLQRLRAPTLALLLAFAAPPAAAEIYSCVGADGKKVFTGDPSVCKQKARPHKLRGQVQRVDKSTTRSTGSVPPGALADPSAMSPRARRARQQATEAAQEATWRAKRRQAEREQAELEHHLRGYRSAVAWCNRGGDLFAPDASGLKKRYSCDEARKELTEAESRKTYLDQYLSGGLQEECRRAGCLPGWIR